MIFRKAIMIGNPDKQATIQETLPLQIFLGHKTLNTQLIELN